MELVPYELGRNIVLEDEDLPSTLPAPPMHAPTQETIDKKLARLEADEKEESRLASLANNWEDFQNLCAAVAEREVRGRAAVACENCGCITWDPDILHSVLKCNTCKLEYTFARFFQELRR